MLHSDMTLLRAVVQAVPVGMGSRIQVEIAAGTAGNRVGPVVELQHLQDCIFVGIFVDPEVVGTAEGCHMDLKC